MFSSPHRPSPPSSLLKTKRKVSGADDSPIYPRYEGGSSYGHGSPSRKVRPLLSSRRDWARD